LRRIKLLHTVVWAFFATCVAAIPLAAATGRLGLALLCIGCVLGETLVLLLNRWRCPLTDVAARHTQDRRDNFDIHLPEWLARHNKLIFGSLFVAGSVYTVLRWLALSSRPAG
jgi:hypothetical protein